ncbi:hypothetical protein N7481_005119 [Penicillium waksmanii]|uniref:uncharacterized protein n=1 Tax=Penicillium waksmanii TaxID=69791 RepID=UPI0025479549|nr:uncharacterized protein N7481_005119 [Penicillium waksmanii]KAJ5983020.1 hypothetical protein N7481_005119 [Penicillium waksmanii]
MPPRRRTAASGQSTLSFGTQSRVTKPSTAPRLGKNLDKPASGTPEPQDVIVSQPPNPHAAELVVRQQVKPATQEPLLEEDKRALKMSKQDLNRYWKKEEQARLAPRVHQGDLAMEEKILRHFDLSSQYGPCIGIARIKRWRRANKLKLNPPLEVLAVLLKNEEVEERAHMDELLS